jgi:amidase
MAGSIDDLAISYRVMAAPAPAEDDAVSSAFPNPLVTIPSASAESSRPKIIGLFRPWFDHAEPAVRAIFDAAVEFYCSQQGYTVIDIEIPYLPQAQRAHVLTFLAEAAANIDVADIPNLLPHGQLLLTVGNNKATAQDFVAAQKMRQLLMSHMGYLFTRHPGLIIMTPTTPIPGWKIIGGEKDLTNGVSDTTTSVRNMSYAWLANFIGCPAINCPAGYAPGTNIPVGIMGMSEWGSEEALISFARDGEGILDIDIDAGKPTGDDTVVVGKGARIPSGKGSQWVDVIVEAGKKQTTAPN